MCVGGNVENAIGDHWRRVDWRPEIRCAQELLLLAGFEDHQVAVLVTDIHLAVGDQCGAPHVRLHVVRPIDLAGLRVQAMQVAGEVTNEQEAVGGDGHRRDTAVDLVIRPDLPRLRDVPGLGGVNAGENAHPFAMLRILADGVIDAVLPEDGSSVDFAGALGVWILKSLSIRRVAVIPPYLFEVGAVAFLHRLGVKRIAEAVAAAVKYELATIDTACGRGTPQAVEHARADLRVVLGEELAGALVQCDQAGRVGGGNIGMRPVLPVGGYHIHHIADDQRCAVRSVMWEDAQFVDHVVAPDGIGVLWAGFDRRCAPLGRLALVQYDLLNHVFGLVLVRAVVAISHPFCIEAKHFAAAGYDIHPVTLARRRGEQAEAFPIVHLARCELRHHELPKQLAGLLVEAHQDAPVAHVP